MKRLQLNNKKYIFCSILVFIIFLVVYIFKFTYTPVFIEKENFSITETEMIYEVLALQTHQAHIDKLTFSHAQDTLFIIYISNLESSSIMLNYSEYDSYGFETYYKQNNNPNIKCILYENDEKHTAIFRIECYNENLYDVIKST